MRITALLVVIAACGNGGSGGGLGTRAITAEEATPLCMADCQHDIDCGDTGQDLALCTQSCVDELAGWARADAVNTVLECTTMLACMASDDACAALVQPLEIHEQFEAMCRSNLTCVADLDCEVSGEGESSIFRLIAPEIMVDINACYGMGDCMMQIECIQAQLELHGIFF